MLGPYACRPLSLEGSASCSRALVICLQRQHAMARHRRSQPPAVAGLYLYTVRKNSRSPAGVQAQCCFVMAALIGAALAETAETGAFRRSPETLVAPDRRPEFRHLTLRRAAYVPQSPPSTAASSSLALCPR